MGGRWFQGSNHRPHIKEAVPAFLETRVRRTLFSPYWVTEIILLFILCVCEKVRKLVKFEVRPILTCLFIAGVLVWFLLPAADGLTKHTLLHEIHQLQKLISYRRRHHKAMCFVFYQFWI